jgi:hypothetical protein
MRPLNAGELAMATPIESFTAVLLQLNMHYKTRVAVRLTGIPDDDAGDAVTPPTGGAAPAEPPGDGKGNGTRRRPKADAPAEPAT